MKKKLRFYTPGDEQWRGIPDVENGSRIRKWPANNDGSTTISWTYLDQGDKSGFSSSEGEKLKQWMSELTNDIGCIK